MLDLISTLSIDLYILRSSQFRLANQEKIHVANETITDTNPTVTKTDDAEPVGNQPKTRAPRKKAAPKSKRTGTASSPAATKVAIKAAKAVKAASMAEPATLPPLERKRNKYTPAQRASILASIEKATKGGKSTLKVALQQAEVSEQTYYNWKNAAAKHRPVSSTGLSSDDLSSLVALEAENLKLRKELAAKLRAENEELRKRLGRA
jgi:putative transposase